LFFYWFINQIVVFSSLECVQKYKNIGGVLEIWQNGGEKGIDQDEGDITVIDVIDVGSKEKS
jgi:hypothetical protein